MASLPPRQQSQRRPSPDRTTQTQSHAPSSPIRAHSEHSQTLFLNSADQQEDSLPREVSPDDQEQHPQTPPHQTTSDESASSINKCWICFADSTEDTPQTSPWRDPCPCALVAHEECLLDWIADMENPTNTRRGRGNAASSLSAPQITCPQCKSEIKLARPRNLVVEAVRGIERLGAQLVTPGALTTLFGMVYGGSMAAGLHSVYAVFGAEDGERILRPLLLNWIRPPLELENATAREMGERLLGVAVEHVVHWRLYLGLPLITPVLVLSRTTFADSVLPVLPILFFATQTHSSRDTLDFGHWPPSASLAFAVLPYARSAYNLYYQKVWAEREKRWLKEIQPRVGHGQGEGGENAGNAEQGDGGQDRDDDNVFEVRIDGGIWEDWEDGDSDEEAENENEQAQNLAQPVPNNVPLPLQPEQQQDAQQNDQQANPPPNIPDNRAAEAEDPQQPDQPNAPAQPPHHHPPAAAAGGGGGERRLSFSPTAIAETLLGALLFPTLAGLSGELLKLALPRSWTTPPPPASSRFAGRMDGRMAAKGLLQEKWGRSLVGGCLFVVVKDAVLLYVRWKMVEMHRRRRVLDYEGKGDKKGGGEGVRG